MDILKGDSGGNVNISGGDNLCHSEKIAGMNTSLILNSQQDTMFESSNKNSL